MGAKQTKIEGSYLPETPRAIKLEQANKQEAPEDNVDPRSPGAQRTPIAAVKVASQAHEELMPLQEGTLSLPLAVLRRRFFKAAFSYNLNDPRSPTVQLNRTPLIFEEQHERSLDLDDTFADLFIDSKRKSLHEAKENTPIETQTRITETNTIDHTNKAIDEAQQREITAFLGKLEQTPSTQQLDPRSPTIGVERTPLIFSDDDDGEAAENVLLERVLATLI